MAEEQEARLKHERQMREETEERWDSLRKLQDEEISNIREIQKVLTSSNFDHFARTSYLPCVKT